MCVAEDSGGIDLANCGFGDFPVTHFEPCSVAIEPATPNWIVINNVDYHTIDGGPGAPIGQQLAQVPPFGLNVRIVRVHEFRVEAGANLTIKGPIPLIVVADIAIIDGIIMTDAGSGSGSCFPQAINGVNGNMGCSGGGAGAAFAGTGGQGGTCSGASGAAPTAANGEPMQLELRGGCKGGKAGTTGGDGGPGGGGLQISATTSIRISGMISAPGRGGLAGSGFTGGGGGGSGGAIFLEAPSIVMTNTAHVCANGGAGGEGASSGTGESGLCVDTPARSTTNTNGGNGGNGGTAMMINGTSGIDGPPMDCPTTGGGMPCGGGGGGGGVGRIRAHTDMLDDAGATVTPALVR